MFCSHCGVKACGKFCHQCGSLLDSPDAILAIVDKESGQNMPRDWEDDPLRSDGLIAAIVSPAAMSLRMSASDVLCIGVSLYCLIVMQVIQ